MQALSAIDDDVIHLLGELEDITHEFFGGAV